MIVMTAAAMGTSKACTSKTKALTVASGGGHWVQLRQLRASFSGGVTTETESERRAA